jgi:hypothetical protein
MTTAPDDESSFTATVDELSIVTDDGELSRLVTDDGQTLTMPRALLPAGATNGDVLLVRLERDPAESHVRRQRVAELQQRLFGGESTPGDLE